MPWSLGTSSGTMTLPFRRRRYVVNEPDPVYHVIYLGNVLTQLAKGDGCVDKPLSLIWKTHTQRTRPDLNMKLSVARSGLKAETKLQGLTEYWAHRITFCIAPTQYPRVFCWIYKHEGKKLKPELRCHAVLCKRLSDPPTIALKLYDTLGTALREYKREKLFRQNIRLSGQHAGCPTMPRRKILLSTGSQNFRPPLSRSKSAPRLGSIDEGKEEMEEVESPLETCEFPFPEAGVVVEDLVEPGTPREIEFHRSSVSSRRSLPEIFELNGGGVQKLRLDDSVFAQFEGRVVPNLADLEPDSISDESGYHEKSSLEGESGSDDEEPQIQITAL